MLFSGGARSTSPRPISRTVRKQRRFVREQEIQRIGGEPHRHGVEPPPALVALEHVGLSDIHAEPRGIDDHFGQRRDILQAHIEPLPRDRVNHMRGVADQRQPFADEGARDEIAERKRARLVERLDLAEMQPKAPLEFAVKFVVAQGDDARGFLAVLGPYQRGAFARQRQDRERTCGQKMLFGAALMIALVADGDDDAGLIVIPAMGGDPCALAQFRARAVGGNQQARVDDRAVGKRHARRHRRANRMPSPRWRADRCPQRPRARPARRSDGGSRPYARTARRVRHRRQRSGTPDGWRPPGLESVTTMSRIGCAPSATWSQTPSASNSRRQAATIAVARGSRLGRTPSAGSATMTGISAPRPWRSANASASPANAPPPMTMLRCADMRSLLCYFIKRRLLPDNSWAKQGHKTRFQVVIPGRYAVSNPESRDSGFTLSRAPERRKKAFRCPKA